MIQTMYKHYSMVPDEAWRWKNFAPTELACRCCGELYVGCESMDMLQRARDEWGRPLVIYSGHRCLKHNTEVGGAANSQHLKIAFDIAIGRYDRYDLLACLKRAGFSTFGYYETFIHTDIRPGKWWFGPGARESWKGLVF